VTGLDLLTNLIYAHAIPQGASVASVTVRDGAGREVTRVLRAGLDTAEASYWRPEFVRDIRHSIAQADVVRQLPTHAYSMHRYPSLIFRARIDLPMPMRVARIDVRYLHPVGQLTISDVFLREF
jgi:hypothetical protein